jgi:hypothetical protein
MSSLAQNKNFGSENPNLGWMASRRLVYIHSRNAQATWVQHGTGEVSHVRLSTSEVGVVVTGYRSVDDVTLEFVRKEFVLYADEEDLRDIHDGFAWDMEKVGALVEAVFPVDGGDMVAA